MRLAHWITVLVTAALVLWACGDDSSDASASTPTSNDFNNYFAKVDACVQDYESSGDWSIEYRIRLFSRGFGYGGPGTRMRERHEEHTACVVAAQDCSGVLECFGIDTDTLCDRGVRCADSNTLERCEDGNLQHIDCSKYGENSVCMTLEDKDDDCGVGICGDEGFPESTEWCIGNNHTYCSNAGWAAGQSDCSIGGRVCEQIGTEAAGCVPKQHRCAERAGYCEDAQTSVWCRHYDEDEVVVERHACEVYGADVRCRQSSTGAGCAAETSCIDDGATCDGNTLNVCVDGIPMQLDCTVLPGGHCVDGRCKAAD